MTPARVEVTSVSEWETWLHTNHVSSAGIWLVTPKKGHRGYLTYDEIVDVAICYGWVDSQPRSVDSTRSERLLSPRRAGSNWSRVNKLRVARLTRAGRMTAAGLAVVAAAKLDGSWTALDQVEDLIESPELSAALDAAPAARAHWDTFPRAAKRAILEWISTARTDATRIKRIATTVAEASAGRRANQWRQPKSTPTSS